MTPVSANNAEALTTTALDTLGVVVTLDEGASLFPTITADSYFVATLSDITGLIREIVWVVDLTNNIATLVRAQEGTSPLSWPVGSMFQNLWTSGQAELIGEKTTFNQVLNQISVGF